MMAVWVASGALLLVVLIGGSYSYPMKQGFEPSSSYGSSYENPSAGSKWEGPSSGKFIPAASGSGSTSKMFSKSAPRKEVGYPQTTMQRQPAAPSYSSNSYTAPAGYDGPAQPASPRPSPLKDFNWAHPPPHPFSGGETATRPSAQQFVSNPGLPSPPAFQAGELAHVEKNYEHGNYESETEEQGYQSPPLVQASIGQDITSDPNYPGNYFFPYPSFDLAFLTGRNPPGTVSFSRKRFEHGTDHRQDHHYMRDYPAYPSTQQQQTFTMDFEAPQSITQPSQLMYQSFDGTSFGQSAATDAAGLYDSPIQDSLAGGYSMSEVGY